MDASKGSVLLLADVLSAAVVVRWPAGESHHLFMSSLEADDEQGWRCLPPLVPLISHKNLPINIGITPPAIFNLHSTKYSCSGIGATGLSMIDSLRAHLYILSSPRHIKIIKLCIFDQIDLI